MDTPLLVFVGEELSEVGGITGVVGEEGTKVDSKNGNTSYQAIQLGLRTLPPSFPPEQLEISATAPSKQILQSICDKSGVHCTSPYTFIELLKLFSPTAKYFILEEPNEACLTRLPIKLYSV